MLCEEPSVTRPIRVRANSLCRNFLLLAQRTREKFGHAHTSQRCVVMMTNELGTYKEGPKAYEFKGTNGFMLTFCMTSKDIPATKGSSMSYDKAELVVDL